MRFSAAASAPRLPSGAIEDSKLGSSELAGRVRTPGAP